MVAVEHDGTPRVPSEAAMIEYVLAMATGDADLWPKGGWEEYHNGEHAKPSLHGKKRGELLGPQKDFGKGGYADAPFRYRAIAEQLRSGCLIGLSDAARSCEGPGIVAVW